MATLIETLIGVSKVFWVSYGVPSILFRGPLGLTSSVSVEAVFTWGHKTGESTT